MFRAGSVAFLGASSVALAARRAIVSYAEQPKQSGLDREKAALQSAVVISLSPQSRDNLKEYLQMNKYEGIKGSYVVINKGLTKGDIYQYEPLFGERAAFRLKGVIQSSKKSAAGFGRVAIMSGEIRDEALVASLPLQLETDEFVKETHGASIDLPTQLAEILSSEESESDRKPAVDFKSMKQADEDLVISHFPKMHQIVLEGRLCRADMLDGDGNCTFDRSQLMSDSDLDNLDKPPSMVPSESAAIVTDNKYTVNEETEKEECPVCRYMKAGPCKPEFIKWDECVAKIAGDESAKACFPQTVEMMTCFKKFEYYDIMTAGTRPHLYKQPTEVVDP